MQRPGAPGPPDQWITTRDAAFLLRLSQEAVRRLEDTGVLPATRTPTGLRIFRRADVEQLAQQRADRRAK
jgi:excisionase family DNA binding protein